MTLTQQETQTLIELLGKLEWPLQKEVFHALMAKVVSVPIELCVLDGANRILTFYRKDHEYNCHHTPGTVLRNDENVSQAIKRLIESELVGYEITDPKNIGWVEVQRGNHYGGDPNRHEISLVFLAYLIKGEYSGGKGVFSPLDALPEDILSSHRVMSGRVKQYLEDDKPILG